MDNQSYASYVLLFPLTKYHSGNIDPKSFSKRKTHRVRRHNNVILHAAGVYPARASITVEVQVAILAARPSLSSCAMVPKFHFGFLF